MEYEAITNFYLDFKNIYILGNKKIRVGRVIGNEYIFFMPYGPTYDGASVKAEKKKFSTVFPKTAEKNLVHRFSKTAEKKIIFFCCFWNNGGKKIFIFSALFLEKRWRIFFLPSHLHHRTCTIVPTSITMAAN